MANTIRIKRRSSAGATGAPASLENAELAYNEADDTLYYGKGTGGAGGTATSVEAIAGSGAYVTKGTTQTLTGNKTFSGTVIVPTPTANTHAATKAYVDGAISGFTGYAGFVVAGDSGSNQTIDSEDTLTIAGGTGIDTVSSNTDTLTINIDSTVATLSGSQTLTNKTIGDSGLTFYDGTGSSSSMYAGGSDLTIYGHNNLYLNTNNADIILQPDGYAKVWGEVIATQDWVGGQGYLTSAVTTIAGTSNQITASASTGGVTLSLPSSLTTPGDLTVTGDLVVQGNTTTLNTATLVVEDKNVVLANVSSPTNTTADGAGLTVLGSTNKTWNWINSTAAWTSSEHVDLAAGKAFYIGGTSVLSNTALGSTVTGSSLTSLGTIATGVWQGTAVGIAYGLSLIHI